jgi:Domain of unknown function (DUF5060)
MRGDITELSLTLVEGNSSDWLGTQVMVTLTSPTGILHRVDGFYDGAGWKARFWPDELGHWSYHYDVMIGPDAWRQVGQGEFDSVPGSTDWPVERNPTNPYRWILADGTPYYPLGIEDCMKAKGDQLPGGGIDGGTRGEQPPRSLSLDEYFRIYAAAGFNLLRFSQQNCSSPLFDDLDHYRWPEMHATDGILALARKDGLRVMFGFFGFYNGGMTNDQATMQKQERFIRYAIARWGVYVDFWELLNESQASDAWTSRMAQFVHSIDPEHRPVSTSFEKPGLPAVDINAPHWFESESELTSDLRVQQLADNWKSQGKPVIVGEQGNSGMNWDPLSGERMRIRAWTALFQEITLVFWNTSWAKDGMFGGVDKPGAAANIYLGPEERGYTRVLHDYASWLDAKMRIEAVQVSDPSVVRAYALKSDSVAAVYLHHFQNHTTTASGITIELDLPAQSGAKLPLTGRWIDPATGNVVGQVSLGSGRQTLQVPPFLIDLALLVTSSR